MTEGSWSMLVVYSEECNWVYSVSGGNLFVKVSVGVIWFVVIFVVAVKLRNSDEKFFLVAQVFVVQLPVDKQLKIQ